MKTKLLATVVIAASAFTSLGASAEIFNSWAFDQMSTPSTRTRAEVKAEVVQSRQGEGKAATAFTGGALAQQDQPAPVAASAPSGPQQASRSLIKTSQP